MNANDQPLTTTQQTKRGRKLLYLAIFILLAWIALHLILRAKPLATPIMISHRGAAGLAPENTLVSVREALSQCAEYVEVDVQRSADGALVIMHDPTVDRTTDGQGAIRDLTWEEIRQLDAGSHFSPEFAGEPVPSLDEVLELIKASSAHLILEVKNPELYPGIEGQITEVFQKLETNDRVTVVSFDHGWLKRFNELAPNIPIGYLWLWPYRASNIVNVHWFSVILDPTLVWRMHRQGAQVWVWTANDKRLMRLLLWLGVDGITTDHPEAWPEASEKR